MGDENEDGRALEAAVDALDEDGPGWSGVQLSLLPSEVMKTAEKRGRGRPPGAMNKATKEWAAWLNANYTNPLVFLAEACNRSAASLALELSCTKEKAFSLQLAAASKLLEYTNQKMPQAIELPIDGDLTLIIQTTTSSNDDESPGMGGGLIIDVPEDRDDGETG